MKDELFTPFIIAMIVVLFLVIVFSFVARLQVQKACFELHDKTACDVIERNK